MKVGLTAVVMVLLVGGGSLIGNRSAASPEPPQPVAHRLTVTPHGTLQKLLAADGSNHSLLRDGFNLIYKIRGSGKLAFAKGPKTEGLKTSLEPPRHAGNMATAVAQTVDNVLKIRSDFTFNENTKVLVIKRTFQNISPHPVTVQMVRNYLDPSLEPQDVRAGLPVTAGCLTNLSSLSDLTSLTASLTGQTSFKCPPPPVCPWERPCPPNSLFLSARWDGPQAMETILWSEQVKLKPKQPNKPPDETFVVVRVVIK